MAPTTPFPPPSQITYECFTTVHLAANATTTIKTGEGMLYCVTVNTKGATANTCTVTLDGATMGVIDTTSGPASYFYLAKYVTSLAVTIATGTAADITVTYA